MGGHEGRRNAAGLISDQKRNCQLTGKSVQALFPIFTKFTCVIRLGGGARELPKTIMYLIYGLMVIIGMVAMYSLLNMGNPDSLLRLLFSDAGYDFYVAVISSVLVFVMGFFVFYSRDREGFRQLIQLNADQIHESRKQGKNNEEIADSILDAMGSTSGYRHSLARKKLIVALSEFK
jgi:ABC-type nickel/cobalt efflux system permease component RcnA